MSADSMYNKEVERISKARREAYEAVHAFPNVIGSMIGYKRKQNKKVDILSLILFVTRKLPKEELDRYSMLPDSIKTSSGDIPLDVVQWSPLRHQNALFPSGARLISNGTNVGTLSSYCRKGENYFALTCAHVLQGVDGSLAPPRPIRMRTSDNTRYIEIGTSEICVDDPGQMGLQNLFDAGLLALKHPSLRNLVAQATPVMPANAVAGEMLSGWGAATGGPGGRLITGRVEGIDCAISNLQLDLLIHIISSPGTHEGDSGMLWKNAEGEAVAIHVMGNDAEITGSSITGAMTTARIVERFDITLVDC